MNKEFKTLKDLRFATMEVGDCVEVDDLKENAIKHYKAVKNGNLVIDVPTYIRWANNLEDEDLMTNEFNKKTEIKKEVSDSEIDAQADREMRTVKVSYSSESEEVNNREHGEIGNN